MGSNIVSLNLKSTSNSFNENATVANKIIDPNLLNFENLDQEQVYKTEQKLEEAFLFEKEYTFEELMEFGKKNQQRAEDKFRVQTNLKTFIDKKEPSEQKFWNKAWDYTGAFVFSAVEGFINLGEGVVDAHFYGVAKTIQVFGVDDKWAENIISYDFSENMYNFLTEKTGIDNNVANGTINKIGNFVGEWAGDYALSSVPYVGLALCSMAEGGSTVEEKMNQQLSETGTINDWSVFAYSILGAFEGLARGKAVKGLREGISAFKEIGWEGIKDIASSTLSNLSKDSFINTLKTGFGVITKKAFIDTITDFDTWSDTICVLGKDVITGIETGEWNWEEMIFQVGNVWISSYVSNLGSEYLEVSKNIEESNLKSNSIVDDVEGTSKTSANIEDMDIKDTGDVEELIIPTDNLSTQTAYEIELESIVRSKIEALGYDTTGKSYDDLVKEFPDALDSKTLTDISSSYFEVEYGKPITDIKNDPSFRDEMVELFTQQNASGDEYAVLGKWQPKDECVSYTALNKNSSANITIDGEIAGTGTTFDYGTGFEQKSIEGVYTTDECFEYLNKPYLDNQLDLALSGKKDIILTTGPNSTDWATGYYGKELQHISDRLGLSGIDDLKPFLKDVPITVDGKSYKAFKLDLSTFNK